MKVTPVVFYILFAIASSKKEVSGYDIMLIIRHFSLVRLGMGSGTIYPTLKKLKKIGWIEQVRVSMEIRKKFYRLTERGRVVLRQELRQLDKTMTMAYKVGLLPLR